MTGLEFVPAVGVTVLAEALLLLADKPDQLWGVLVVIGDLLRDGKLLVAD